VAFVAPDGAAAVLAAMRATPEGRESSIIGRVVEQHPGMALLKTEIGGTRVLDLPFNEQLPRIC
jgi:hydrogenase expression/formation protein HypE